MYVQKLRTSHSCVCVFVCVCVSGATAVPPEMRHLIWITSMWFFFFFQDRAQVQSHWTRKNTVGTRDSLLRQTHTRTQTQAYGWKQPYIEKQYKNQSHGERAWSTRLCFDCAVYPALWLTCKHSKTQFVPINLPGACFFLSIKLRPTWN